MGAIPEIILELMCIQNKRELKHFLKANGPEGTKVSVSSVPIRERKYIFVDICRYVSYVPLRKWTSSNLESWWIYEGKGASIHRVEGIVAG